MTGGTLDSSEDALSEEEDCGIYAFLGECSCDLENLATTNKADGLQVGELVLKQIDAFVSDEEEESFLGL